MLLQKIKESLPPEVLNGGKFAVAFSGGADSLALLLALNELVGVGRSDRLMALHCNFHLRGDESDADTDFCRELCERLGVRLEVKDFQDVADEAQSTGESVEMVCRRLRYEWFEGYTHKGWYLAIAHHVEDNRETFFINLLRGTGIKGLMGMAGHDSNRRIVRPMLGTSRHEIELYLRKAGKSWRSDSTNALTIADRNKLRLKVIPSIGQWFPSGFKGIDQTMDNLRADYALLQELFDRIIPDVLENDNTIINLIKLSGMTSQPARVLLEILAPLGFNYSQCRSIAEGSMSGESRQFIVDRGTLYTRGAEAFFLTNEDENQLEAGENIARQTLKELCEGSKGELSLDTVITSSPLSFVDDVIIKEKDIASLYVDADSFDKAGVGCSMEWRGIGTGDRFRPFGMKGRRLVSDYLSDIHATPLQKKMSRVLIDGHGDIVWLAPFRASSSHRITDNTRRIYKITYNHQPPTLYKFRQ